MKSSILFGIYFVVEYFTRCKNGAVVNKLMTDLKFSRYKFISGDNAYSVYVYVVLSVCIFVDACMCANKYTERRSCLA